MLFWLFVILFQFGVFIMMFSQYDFGSVARKKNYFLEWVYYNHRKIESFGLCISIVSFFVIAGSLVIILVNGICSISDVASKKETYESLCYKVESEEVRDEFGLLNKEIVDEIQEWNEEIARKQSVQDNFWLGIYNPNVYDEFEKIPLEIKTN